MQKVENTFFDNIKFDENNNSELTCSKEPKTCSCLDYMKDHETPGSSLRRKVQFADILGHALVSVKVITPTNSEESLDVHKKPDSAVSFGTPKEKSCLNVLVCRFRQPASETNFMNRVQKQFVCLENLTFCGRVVIGVVRVLNIAFAKEVTVRYTTNNWCGQMDVWADYVPNSSDGITDKFSFRISLPTHFSVGDRLEFAVSYKVAGNCYWDNNDKQNYLIDCCCSSRST